MGNLGLPARSIRQIIGAVDLIVQIERQRDGARRVIQITDVCGMEGDTIITQDLFVYDLIGEDANGKIIGRHRSTGIGRPRFWERARYYGEENRLAAALDAAEVVPKPGASMYVHASARTGLSRVHRDRRHRLGVRLTRCCPARRKRRRAAPRSPRPEPERLVRPIKPSARAANRSKRWLKDLKSRRLKEKSRSP